MITVVVIAIIFISLVLMGAVLVQNPKGGGLDSTFGGGGNQMFGAARSGDFIEKFTWYCAIALFVLCVLASYLA